MSLLFVVERFPFLASPATVALLLGMAVGSLWMALRPGRPKAPLDERIDSYTQPSDALQEEEMRGSIFSRVFIPGLRRLLGFLGRFLPGRSLEQLQEMLVRAGEPGRLSALDFQGLRLLLALGVGLLWYASASQRVPAGQALFQAGIAGAFGFLLPKFWLGGRVRRRQREILRALPNAMDMMTIGVEAGLAFESAMLRVSQRWRNALTVELVRVAAEMNVGVSREEALRRMANRTDVPDLRTFVAVLVQSAELGMSIADVLHTQAAQMRLKRRQRAEERVRQAVIKLVVVLVFFIFPALMIVILGPTIPRIVQLFVDLNQ